VTTVLLSRSLRTEFQKALKNNSGNNVSIQNTMSDSMVAYYFKETSDSKQKFIKDRFKNLDEDTKMGYLESIDQMKAKIDSRIERGNDILSRIEN